MEKINYDDVSKQLTDILKREKREHSDVDDGTDMDSIFEVLRHATIFEEQTEEGQQCSLDKDKLHEVITRRAHETVTQIINKKGSAANDVTERMLKVKKGTDAKRLRECIRYVAASGCAADAASIQKMLDAADKGGRAGVIRMCTEELTEELQSLYLTAVNRLLGMYATLLKFYMHDKRVFNVSRGLLEMLHSTDLGGVHSQLRYPFKTFYVNFGSAFRCIDEAYVVGVYVDTDYKKDRVVFTASKNDNTYAKTFTTIDRSSTRKITVEDFNSGGGSGVAVDEYALLAVKVLLYLNSEKPDVALGDNVHARTVKKIKKAKEHQKTDRLTKYLSTLSPINPTEVGRNIKINKHPQDTSVSASSPDGDFHYSSRFWVRGHFRNQPFGPRDDVKHRNKWIKPYLKGPDQAEIISRQYDVE